MFALLLSIITLLGPAQTDTIQVSTQISAITVYQNQAQAHRSYQHTLPSGISTLIFQNLSESLIEESIQLTGNGSFTLLALSTKTSFEESTSSPSKLTVLIKQKENIEDEITARQSQIEVIQKEITFIDQSKSIVADNKLSTAELNELLASYRENLTDALNRKNRINKELRNLRLDLNTINQQINESGRTIRSTAKEVIAVISLEAAATIEFELSYLVNNAGWFPTYDIRSESINDPVELTYKANIYQQTGQDWKDVSFTINSGDPSSNAIKPSLDPLFLKYVYPSAGLIMRGTTSLKPSNQIIKTMNEGIVTGRVLDSESGQPLQGASVFVEGTSIGTSTDANGNFRLPKLQNGTYRIAVEFVGFVTNNFTLFIRSNGYEADIKMEADIFGLDDVVVTAYGIQRDRKALDYSIAEPEIIQEQPTIIQNNVINNQTSFSYELETPYSVPSDGKTHSVDIKREHIASDFTYGSVPKLSDFAYLETKFNNSSELNLLAGEANIYFENRFVGTSFLNPNITQDSISVSLGKDEQIVINRKLLTDFSSKNFFRNKVKELQMYEITVKNTKNEPISIVLEDQIPISGNDDIDISIKELSNGVLDNETGIVTWKLHLEPGESTNLRLGFEIEYQKGKKVNI